MRKNIKRNIYIMYALSLLQGMVFYAPVATLYRQNAGVSIFGITIIESISLFLCLVLEMPWGIVADRIGYKKTMVFCCVLYFISKIVFWRAEGFFWFLAERIMLSVVISGFSGVDISILYLSCEEGSSQKVFSVFDNCGTVGLLFAAFVYSAFVGGDYRLSGWLTVLSYAAAMLISFFLIEVKEKESKLKSARETFVNFKSQSVTLLKNKYFLLFLIGVALLSETHQTVTVFLNQLQYVKSGMSQSAIGVAYIIVTLAGFIGLLSDRLTKKLGVRRMGAILYLISVAACMVLTFTGNLFFSVASVVFIRVSFSLFQPLQTDIQNKQIITGDRATALSINAVIIDSVGIATNIIFGKLADFNLSLSFVFGAAVCLAGLCMYLLWFSEKPLPGSDI